MYNYLTNQIANIMNGVQQERLMYVQFRPCVHWVGGVLEMNL